MNWPSSNYLDFCFDELVYTCEHLCVHSINEHIRKPVHGTFESEVLYRLCTMRAKQFFSGYHGDKAWDYYSAVRETNEIAAATGAVVVLAWWQPTRLV